MARIRLRVAAVGVLIVAGAVAWYSTRPSPSPTPDTTDDIPTDPPPPDPRLTFDTPFRNVKPEVGYVGDKRCADCHGNICATYREHPMGRSAEFVRGGTSIEKFGAGADKPRVVEGYELRVSKTPDRVVQRLTAKDPAGAPLPEYTVSAKIAIGSGTRGRSYLWVEQGAVWQSPIGWVTGEEQWKLFPGFYSKTGGAWPAHADCLFCHVDRVEAVPQSLNRYREPLFPLQAAIGCERCHGPGALHVAERSAGAPAGKIDTSIVNPKHLAPDLQMSICAQCHLGGQERVERRGRNVFEFRPGLPFELFVSVFVRHPDLVDLNHSGGQFEQLEQTKCRTAGGGRLGCPSCHDPHATPAPAARAGFYRGRCLACHESKPCTAPRSARTAKGDSCTECHMPRDDNSKIAHVSVTDHHILRRPAVPVPGGDPGSDAVPLVAFRTGPHAPPSEERERDLGIAFARLSTKIPPSSVRERVARERVAALAIDRLAPAVARWRGDADAWVGLGAARGARGEWNEWMTAATNATKLAPDSEPALTEEAAAALKVERFDRAADVATKLIQLNPSSAEHRYTRATARVRQRAWDKAEEDLRWILDRNPLHVQARFLVAVCRHRLGDVAGGQKEAETAAGLVPDPRQREELLKQYRWETR